jgi:hypothetical protein
MKSRDLGTLLFGLAGLYSLLLAVLGAALLLLQLSAASGSLLAPGGQLRVPAGFVSGAASALLHFGFGAVLLGARRGLADWLLGEEGASAATSRRGARGERAAAVLAPSSPALRAQGFAAAGVCLLAILLLSRAVTALAYGVSLLWLRGNAGDVRGWTTAGMLVDLLLAAGGALLIAARHRVAARLVAGSPPRAGSSDRDGAGMAAGRTAVDGSAEDDAPAAGAGDALAADDGDAPAAGSGAGGASWELPVMRLLGLGVLVWHLPELASAVSVFVKWWLRPQGFDLRAQTIERIPPAAIGVAAGLYFLLAFPAGLGPLARRLRIPEAPAGRRSRAAGRSGRRRGH